MYFITNIDHDEIFYSGDNKEIAERELTDLLTEGEYEMDKFVVFEGKKIKFTMSAHLEEVEKW